MNYVSFTERDILMRYHWGMGIGHAHAHGISGTIEPIKIASMQYDEAEEVEADQGSLPEKSDTAKGDDASSGGKRGRLRW